MLREQRKKETNSYTQHYSNLCAGGKNKVMHQYVSSAYVWMTELATFVFFLLLYFTFQIFFKKHKTLQQK